MPKLSYKGRIHKAKFSARSLRYIAADQLARTFPALQERWAFPVEDVPVEKVAEKTWTFPTVYVDGSYPEILQKLFPWRKLPVQQQQNVFYFRDAVVTGQAGAVIKDGCLVHTGASPMWSRGLRPRPHKRRRLRDDQFHYNLLSSVASRGHIFHRLFDSLIPLLTWLESGVDPVKLVILVNGELSSFQKTTIDAVLKCYPGLALERVYPDEAVFVPRLLFTAFSESQSRALQTPAALARLDTLADIIARGETLATPRRFFISRDDAKLRRVLNEAEIMARLEPAGFKRVILKGMPAAQQVKLFRDAEAVISPHGAGLAHIAWCKPGTHIFEVFPSPDGPRGRPRNATDDYWLISAVRQFNYRAAFGGPTLNSRDGFEIPVSCLEPALNALPDRPRA